MIAMIIIILLMVMLMSSYPQLRTLFASIEENHFRRLLIQFLPPLSLVL